MDLLRSCYEVQMKFEGIEEPVWVRWYRTDKPFAPHSVYCSRNWDDDKDRSRPHGELSRSNRRRWYNGAPPPGHGCTGPRGSAAAYQGAAGPPLFKLPGWLVFKVDASAEAAEGQFAFELVASAESSCSAWSASAVREDAEADEVASWSIGPSLTFELDAEADEVATIVQRGSMAWTLKSTDSSIEIDNVSILEFDLGQGFDLVDNGGGSASVVVGVFPVEVGGTGFDNYGDLYDELGIDGAVAAGVTSGLAAFTGSSAITTVGNVGAGTWNGDAIVQGKGGTGGTDPATARTALGIPSFAFNTSIQTVASLTLGPIRQWGYVDVTFSDLAAAATTNTITLTVQGAGVAFFVGFAKVTTRFQGGAIATYAIDVGYAATPTTFVASYNVGSVVSGTNFSAMQFPASPIKDFSTTTNIQIKATSTGAFLNAATQGVVRVFFEIANFI